MNILSARQSSFYSPKGLIILFRSTLQCFLTSCSHTPHVIQKRASENHIGSSRDVLNPSAHPYKIESAHKAIQTATDKCAIAEHRHVDTEIDPELEKIRKRKIEEMKAMAAEHGAEQSKLNAPIVAKDTNFDELVNQYPLIVVDCWAPWCGPCHMVAPIIEELARTYAGKVVFSKLNVDENPYTAGRFSIMSIPTLLIMRRGEEADRIVGALPKQVIEEKIRRYIE